MVLVAFYYKFQPKVNQMLVNQFIPKFQPNVGNIPVPWMVVMDWTPTERRVVRATRIDSRAYCSAVVASVSCKQCESFDHFDDKLS